MLNITIIKENLQESGSWLTKLMLRKVVGGITTMWWVDYQPWVGFPTNGLKSSPGGWISNHVLEIQPLPLVGPDVVVKVYHAREESIASKRSASVSPEVSKAGAGCHISSSTKCIFLHGNLHEHI